MVLREKQQPQMSSFQLCLLASISPPRACGLLAFMHGRRGWRSIGRSPEDPAVPMSHVPYDSATIACGLMGLREGLEYIASGGSDGKPVILAG